MAGSLTAGVPDYVDPLQRINMMLRSPRRRDREAAEVQLRYLQHQEQMGATSANLNESIAARMANQAEARAARGQEAGENRARLVQRDREIMQARQDALEQRKASDRDLKAQRVLAMLPVLQQEAGTDKAKRAQITKSIMDQYYQLTGVQNPLAGGAAGPTPAQQALKNVAPKLGQPVAQQQAGTQPAAGTPGGPQFPAVGAAGGPAPTQPEGRFAPGSIYADEGGGAPQAPAPTFQRNVEGGNIVGPLAQQVPAGYDLNINTGEYIPKGQEGTINGIPATQALVAGALRSGVAPIYSPKAMAALGQLQQNAQPGGGLAGKPTLPVGPGGLPDIGTPMGQPAPNEAMIPKPAAAAPTTPVAGVTPPTPGGTAPATPGLQPYGQHTQFDFGAIGRALAPIFTPGPPPWVSQEDIRRQQQPPAFAPATLSQPQLPRKKEDQT